MTILYKTMKNTQLFCLFFLTVSASSAQATDASRAQGGTGYQINDLRSFEVDQDTVFLEDGDPVSGTEAQGGTGYKIRYRVTETSPNLLSGTLSEVNLINIYKGPVVSLSPLRIFNVDNLMTGKTVWHNELSMDQLKLGDQLKVSGFIDSESLVLMTRLERDNSINEWKLSGPVSQVTGSSFTIGQQLVNYQPADLVDCGGALLEGDFVEVLASPVDNFAIGDPVNSVIGIGCVERQVLPEEDDGVVIIEGVVDLVESDDDFFIAGQFIDVGPQTIYIRGKAVDVQERIQLVVEGTADNLTGDVLADKIRFIDPRVNLTVPVTPEDQTGNQFQVAGIVLTVTPQTQDPDGVLNNLTTATQIQFRGYDYGAGEVYITQINNLGQVNYDEVSLNGEVSMINQPFLEVFGVQIDTTSSLLFDQDGLPLTANAFFNLIVAGAEVELEDASLDALTGVMSGGLLSLIELPEDTTEQSLNVRAQGGTGVRGVGTISGIPDVIFIGSFD